MTPHNFKGPNPANRSGMEVEDMLRNEAKATGAHDPVTGRPIHYEYPKWIAHPDHAQANADGLDPIGQMVQSPEQEAALVARWQKEVKARDAAKAAADAKSKNGGKGKPAADPDAF